MIDLKFAFRSMIDRSSFDRSDRSFSRIVWPLLVRWHLIYWIRVLVFDIAWCCQPHRMGYGQHLNLKWIWMDDTRNIPWIKCRETPAVLHHKHFIIWTVLESKRSASCLQSNVNKFNSRWFWHLCRDHFVYAPSQWDWETMLKCNIISHWLGTSTKRSLSSVSWLITEDIGATAGIMRWMKPHSWGCATLPKKSLAWSLGAVSIRKTVLPGMAIPMLKIRRPNGRLIFNMEIAIRR